MSGEQPAEQRLTDDEPELDLRVVVGVLAVLIVLVSLLFFVFPGWLGNGVVSITIRNP
ncbi:MAG: hypothetical protein U0821_03270 [Chloroflexota bacterium]